MAALIAGALDAAVENPLMLRAIDHGSNSVLTIVKALGSWSKWILLAFVAAHILDAFALWLQKTVALKLAGER